MADPTKKECSEMAKTPRNSGTRQTANFTGRCPVGKKVLGQRRDVELWRGKHLTPHEEGKIPIEIMPQTVTASVDSESPRGELPSQKEIEKERNLTNIQMALFIAGVDLESAHQAAKVITSIKPGFIISRVEYQAIHQALEDMK